MSRDALGDGSDENRFERGSDEEDEEDDEVEDLDDEDDEETSGSEEDEEETEGDEDEDDVSDDDEEDDASEDGQENKESLSDERAELRRLMATDQKSVAATISQAASAGKVRFYKRGVLWRGLVR